jgi:hypothetical protein
VQNHNQHLEHKGTQKRSAGIGSPKTQAELEHQRDPKSQCWYRQSRNSKHIVVTTQNLEPSKAHVHDP